MEFKTMKESKGKTKKKVEKPNASQPTAKGMAPLGSKSKPG
jgi:hypothetical protein